MHRVAQEHRECILRACAAEQLRDCTVKRSSERHSTPCAGALTGTLDAAFALSTPDGGMCAHELPLFQMPTAAAHQPTIDTANEELVFGYDETTASNHYLESRSQFLVHPTTNGGFNVAMKVKRSAAASGDQAGLFNLFFYDGRRLSFDVSDTYFSVWYISSNAYSGVVWSGVETTWTILQFNYDSSDHSYKVIVDGVESLSTDAQAGVCYLLGPVPRPPQTIQPASPAKRCVQ